jgi:DNA-binding Lrp family transcriptional regulator
MKRQVILLEDLIDVFEQELGHVLEDVDPPSPGRPPTYPAKGMFLCWLFIYLGVADSQRRLIDLLKRHPEWRSRLGFDRVPDQSTLTWFKNHRASHIFPRIFDETVRRLVRAGIIRGEHVVVDASLFKAYSNPRKVDDSCQQPDPDASWAKETSTGQWVYGYKLHVVSCADSELPIALTVTTGKRNDGPLFPQLLRKVSRFPIPMRVVGADGNYHSAKNHLEAHGLGASTVIPLPKRRHREPRTLGQRLRLHPIIKRDSELYRRLRRKRQSIERVFSRLKSHFNLDDLRGRGLVRVKQHVLLSLTGMLVYALTAAKRGFESLVRSPTRLTA